MRSGREKVETNIARRDGMYEVRVHGFEPVRCRTLTQARDARTRLQDRRRLGEYVVADPITLTQALDETLERAKKLGSRKNRGLPLTPAGYEGLRQATVFWTKSPFARRPLPTLRRAEVEDALVSRAAVAGVSARNELQLLKRALREAEGRGQKVDRALYEIPAVSTSPREGRALTLDQARLLVACVRPDAQRLVELDSTVGCRIGELLSLEDSRVRPDGIWVPGNRNKEKRGKLIPLARSEARLLREEQLGRHPSLGSRVFGTAPDGRARGNGRPWTYGNFHRNVWQPAVEQAGNLWLAENPGSPLDPFRFDLDALDPGAEEDRLRIHDLRHTAISVCAAAGMKIEFVARRVGHADGGALILQRYRHLFRDETERETRLLDAYLEAADADAEDAGAEAGR